MLILKYSSWKVVSKQWDAPHKSSHGKWYLMVYSDFKRNPDHIDYPVIYEDKSVVYENPHRIPNVLRKKIAKLAENGLKSYSENESMR